FGRRQRERAHEMMSRVAMQRSSGYIFAFVPLVCVLGLWTLSLFRDGGILLFARGGAVQGVFATESSTEWVLSNVSTGKCNEWTAQFLFEYVPDPQPQGSCTAFGAPLPRWPSTSRGWVRLLLGTRFDDFGPLPAVCAGSYEVPWLNSSGFGCGIVD